MKRLPFYSACRFVLRPFTPGRSCLLLLLAGLLTAAATLADTARNDIMPGPLHWQPSISDFGGAGLLQTPTARMFDDGEVLISASHIRPYLNGNLTFQPIDWMEVNVRYTSIGNRDYDATHTISTQSYKDKSIDFKFALWDESRYLPDVALGFRDIGGTGLFASEFVVASKRFLDVDLSLGMAWGYMGTRGDLRNPLALLNDGFETRPGRKPGDQGGNVNFKAMFRGTPAFFGGLEYQTPWQPLVLKLEYEGNNYKREPINNPQEQDSPVNIGAAYHLNEYVTLQAGFERGNTAMLGFTLHDNFGMGKPQIKVSDPKPEAVQPATAAPAKPDWQAVSKQLHDNAGYSVSEITVRERELVMRGEQGMFFSQAQGVGRAARILNNQAGSDIDWLTVIDENRGMPVKETSIARSSLQQAASHDIDHEQLRQGLSESAVSGASGKTLFQHDPDPLDYGAGIGYKQSLGGPDQFILYQFTADGWASYHFTPGLWWDGTLSLALLDNYDEFVYDGPSLLPRVRTDVRKYLTSSNVMVPLFQLSQAVALGDDLFALMYTGLFETMYGGAGAEILYRPFGDTVAVGLDINWVKQRGYEQDFTFRPYETVTGHLSTYWDTGYDDVLVTTSVGRYLAKDWGFTLDVSRRFRNGVRMGGFFTRTDVSSRKFGEGSFDKGIYISIPFDLLLTRSTQGQATLDWSPLMRDGGARLNRRHTLFDITDERDLQRFHDSFPQFMD